MTTHTHVIQSPLRLNRYFLKSLSFKINDDFDHGLIPDDANIEVPSMGTGAICEQNPENYRQWRVELRLDLDEPEKGSFPYRLNAALVGYFTVIDRFPTEDIEKLVKTSGASLLYSTARDMVNAITGRSSFRPMILPSVMFYMKEDQPKKRPASAPKQLSAGSKTSRKVAKKK